ncbi:MAG TPA: fused MFS/spermidine synthase [Chitinispirillaceae bacterium]|nr:fused MFS/spermidine synthase [Chitinispirillaceae bacterium]
MNLGRKPFLGIIFILFFLSGFAGLVYESIWTHYLKLFLGHAAYAQTLVLIIYMGGLALGSWLASVYTSKIKNLLRAYAVTELLIGLTALIFHPIFTTYISFSHDMAFPGIQSAFLLTLYKWITASLLILPQTILLGATFPLMTSGSIRLFKDFPGHTIAILYFVNSLGGSLGVLLSGFLLIPLFTLPGTVITAGCIDIVIAVAIFLLTFTRQVVKRENKKKSKSTPPKPEHTSLPVLAPSAIRTTRLMFAFTFGTAASSFIYEIGWIRMLSLVLGSSTHAFELMLATFILGIALGGLFIRKHLDRSENLVSILAVVQVLMGIFAIGTIVFYSNLFYLMEFIMSGIKDTMQGYFFYNFYSQIICMLVMLPATICIGMTLPVITSLLYNINRDESVIGKVYALNTLGSIAGVIIAVHVLMSLIGLKGVLVTGGTVDILIGILIIWFFRKEIPVRVKVVLPVTGFIISLTTILFVHPDPFLLSSGVFRHGSIVKNRTMILYKDGKTSSVAIHKKNNTLSLSVNGKVDASIYLDSTKFGADEFTQLLLAVYPLSYATKSSNVGIVGLGSGMTAATILRYDSVKTVDVVEIEPAVIYAARQMGPKVSNVFSDNRCRIHVEDARTFFSSQQKKYDIIISEPSNPWVNGVSSLFTKEYFKLISKHLSRDGMLAQWFHLYEMNPELLASVLKALGGVFNDYKIFITGTDFVILASNSNISDTPVCDLTKHSWFSPILKFIYINNNSDLALNYLGNKGFFDPLWNVFTITSNSDYNPVLDLRAVKARFLGTDASSFSTLPISTIPIRKILFSDSAHGNLEFPLRYIQPNIYTTAIGAQQTAQLIHYYISSIGTPEESRADSIVPGEAAMAVAKIRMTALDKSVYARKPFAKWSLDMVTSTMPFLNNDEMKSIWSFIDKYAVISGTSESSMELLTMLKAISYENFPEVLKLSQSVLTQKKFSDSQQCRLAFTALLLACIKLNDYNALVKIWDSIKWQDSLDINQQILCAIASEKSRGVISPAF